MNKSLAIGILVAATAAVISLIAWGISGTAPLPENGEDSLIVAATIFPLADIAENIVGEHGDVVLIIPPGISEHDFNVSPETVADLQSADALFQIGLELDDTLVERIQGATEKELPVYSVENGITLREFGEEDEEHEEEGEHAGEEEEHGHEHGSFDPHYWLSAANAHIIAANIANTLSEIDPEHAAQYQENVTAYEAELSALEDELQRTAAGLTQKHFIAIHDAWGYFAEQYGLELVGTYEPIEGREPSPTDLQELQEVIERYSITTFYTEPQKTSTAATRFFEQELGLTIEVLDPVGGTAGRASYIELMRANTAAIARGSQ